MDDIKDIQRTDSIYASMDGRAVRTNPFGQNRSGERAYRRAERIVAAIFLLTNHIANDESVRAVARADALALLQALLSVRHEMRGVRSGAVEDVQAGIRKLISVVRIAAISGFVSPQNADVVVEALDELGNFLFASQRSELSESITISRDELLNVHTAVTRVRERRIVKDIKDIHMSSTQTALSDSVKTSVNVLSQTDMSVRRRSIIEILRSGGSLGIRDIASNLPEYSEKTIQRELVELVSAGTVHKTGSKRWSRYALAIG